MKQENLDEIIPIYGYYDRISVFKFILLTARIIPTGGMIGLVIASIIGVPDSRMIEFGILVVGLLMFITFWSWRNSQSSYEIYPDRIDFFCYYKPKKRETIQVDEIFQVRYEDEFKQQIYLYLKKGYTSKSKRISKDRVQIIIGSRGFINDLITVLKFFQEKKKQVFISTNHKEVKRALSLENWTEPPIASNKVIESFLRFFR